MSTFGDRLRDARKRLGLNQTDFAASGGVQKRAQVSYEQNERFPDVAYLMSIREIGVDVFYLLLCEVGSPTLSSEEAALVKGFRDLDLRGKVGVMALLSGLNTVESHPKAVFHGDVGQVVQGNVTGEQRFDFKTSKSKHK